MKVAAYDLETNGLLPDVHTVHCLVITDNESEEVWAYHADESVTPRAGGIEEGIAHLLTFDRIVGHNIIQYDNEVLKKLYGTEIDPDICFDTTVASRLVYSDRKELDYRLAETGRIPSTMIGRHSLESWGHRLDEHKGGYDGGWETFSQDMLDYCIQDNVVALKLYRVLRSKVPRFKALGLSTRLVEQRFAKQLGEQEQRGAPTDLSKADDLQRRLMDEIEPLAQKIGAEFPPKKVPHKLTSTGKPRMLMCKYRGEKHPDKLVYFNPGSRKQLAARLTQKHGWYPTELTQKGNPAMREDIMHDLGMIYPEVGLVSRYLILKSRLGILSDAPGSYMRLADKEGRIHGRCTHIGAVTHRCSHSQPNLGNVTSIRKPFGLEMREVFVPFPGKEQAGQDADGLELRMLAHYLAPYDKGAYARAVDQGKKEDGTDPHSLHASVISTVVDIDRSAGKNHTYAFLYGAGDKKLGAMTGGDTKRGARIRKALKTKIPGLQKLFDWIEAQYEATKNHPLGPHLISLDGRRVGIRSPHAALNTLLQTAGAVVMKWVPVMIEIIMAERGKIVYGVDYLQTGHIHDETQGSLTPGNREEFTAVVDEAYSRVEKALGIRCPLKGSTDFGTSWADTH